MRLCDEPSVLFPDDPAHEERVRRLRRLDEAGISWLVTTALDERSPLFAGMPDEQFRPLARAKAARFRAAVLSLERRAG